MASSHAQLIVHPTGLFVAENVANELKKAMKGFGTDGNRLIEIMSNHNNKQRLEIAATFKTLFGQDLRSELKLETSGDFQHLLLALLESPVNYDAIELRNAIKGPGTDESALIEIICSKSNHQIKSVKNAYKTLFQRDLEKDVMDDTSGHFKRLLVSLLTCSREEHVYVDHELAAKEAQELFDAGEKMFGTDECTFNRILSLRTFPQLIATFQAYSKKFNKDIEQVIKSETSGDLQEGYLAIVQITRSIPAFYAERLYHSMKGVGTKESALIRITVSRSEIDIVQIMKEFHKKYGKSLSSFIKDDTSGDFQKLLLAFYRDF